MRTDAHAKNVRSTDDDDGDDDGDGCYENDVDDDEGGS